MAGGCGVSTGGTNAASATPGGPAGCRAAGNPISSSPLVELLRTRMADHRDGHDLPRRAPRDARPHCAVTPRSDPQNFAWMLVEHANWPTSVMFAANHISVASVAHPLYRP